MQWPEAKRSDGNESGHRRAGIYCAVGSEKTLNNPFSWWPDPVDSRRGGNDKCGVSPRSFRVSLAAIDDGFAGNQQESLPARISFDGVKKILRFFLFSRLRFDFGQGQARL